MQEEELKRRIELERKRLPKMQKNDIKMKAQQFRKTLTKDKRVSLDVEREKLKEVCTDHGVSEMLGWASSGHIEWCNFTFLTNCPQGKLDMKISCPE